MAREARQTQARKAGEVADRRELRSVAARASETSAGSPKNKKWHFIYTYFLTFIFLTSKIFIYEKRWYGGGKSPEFLAQVARITALKEQYLNIKKQAAALDTAKQAYLEARQRLIQNFKILSTP